MAPPDPPLDANERMWRFLDIEQNEAKLKDGAWKACTTAFYSKTCLGKPDQGISVFLPQSSDCRRLRSGFADKGIAEVTVSQVLAEGFSIVEIPSEEYPRDRHCILRPNDEWSRSQYSKRASRLADAANVIEMPATLWDPDAD